MKAILLELLKSRGMTRYRLGKLMGLGPLKMGTMYQTIEGKRPWRIDYFAKILRAISEVRTFDDSEAHQIVEALLKAGTDES